MKTASTRRDGLRRQPSESILHYEISGSGPVIVLLHGYLSSLRYWDDLRTNLEADHTVLAIDLLGFGGSPKPKTAAYSYADHIAWIERTLEYCGIHEPIVLVGHSMGALLALRYTSGHTTAIKKLVLMNTPFFKDAYEARHQLAQTNLFFRASLYWELHRVIAPLMRNYIMRRILRSALPQNYKGMETYIFSSTAESRARSLRNIIEGQHSLADISGIDVPVTLVQGLMERPMYLENLSTIQPKQGWRVLLANTGHHTLLDNTEFAINSLRL